MMIEEIKKLVGSEREIKIEQPTDLTRGDYAFYAGAAAESLAAKINQQKPAWLERAEGTTGFVNFFLAPKFFAEELQKILARGERYGWSATLAGQKIMVEYTDPNPFKEFHLGHLMSNTIGETISRLIESQGAEIRRACYQGDVGLHVAKAVWADGDYALGSKKYEVEAQAKAEIQALNKKIYERSDPKINKLYDTGRQASLAKFEEIYQKLGTKFDLKLFESEVGPFGQKIVEENLGRVFEKSNGAIIFRGEEKEGLHTRVFINAEGLPTYEAKELGLAKIKYDAYPYDQSIVITGNEINAYFKVLLKVMSLIFPDLATKTKHLSHGMLRLPSGKMSSRTGEVITFESLLSKVREEGGERITEEIALAALKYFILRQKPGKDIIFDLAKAISFTGNSGPYLQYTCVRAKSVLAKANFAVGFVKVEPSQISVLERHLIHFPEVVARAAQEFAPQYLVTYLTELAAAFNFYYAENQIIGAPEESSRLVITAAVAQVLKNGLWLLGIKVPEKM